MKETCLIFYKLLRLPLLPMGNPTWIRKNKYVKESSGSENMIYMVSSLKVQVLLQP
jgi:hypothetical protein